MSKPSSTPLLHRVSGLRAQTTGLTSSNSPSSPLTSFSPSRSSSLGGNSFSISGHSPSTVRSEDELVIIEAGARGLRIGMAGDPTPKAIMRPTPALGLRPGDLRRWQPGWRDDWRRRGATVGVAWSAEHELWTPDVRALDLGLVEDKVERLLRDGLRRCLSFVIPEGKRGRVRFLLLDYKPRKMYLVLPSSLGTRQVSALIEVVFRKLLASQVSLLSTAIMVAVGAGVRSALVIDLGWAETVVTSVYEHHEVRTTRTVRAGKMLVEATHDVLRRALRGGDDDDDDDDDIETGGIEDHVVSFDECEDVCMRLMWCRPISQRVQRRSSRSGGGDGDGGGGSEPNDHDEFDRRPRSLSAKAATVCIPLKSPDRPTTVNVPFDNFADACEETFIAPGQERDRFDDDELPVPLVVYNHLVQVPVDVRAVCMSRIIFTGGCANVLGLRQRIIDELVALVEQQRGWSAVMTNENFIDRTRRHRPTTFKTTDPASDMNLDPDPDLDLDPVEKELARRRPREPPLVQGTLRVLETTGPWTGASLAAHLRAEAVSQIDRDAWLRHGVAGALRSGELDGKMQQQQRHSMGAAAGLKQGDHPWTLGAWGG